MQTVSFSGDPSYLLLVVGALFVHASYQLSVSVLTFFSSHSLSQKTSERRLLVLGVSYGFGAVGTMVLLLCSAASLVQSVDSGSHTLLVLTAFVAPVIGLATILWYYRRGDGTRLWLPRRIAEYLLGRAKKTRLPVEAMMLGAATVLGELPFLIAPLLFVTYVVSEQPVNQWVGWSSIYALLAYSPLFFITMYITSGHSVARLQKWRESNKNFLQWTSGTALVILTIYLTVLQLGVLS